MEYDVIRSRRRTIAAEIRNGRLIVRVPYWVKQREIDTFVAKNASWIESHLAGAQARQEAVNAVPRLSKEDLQELADRAFVFIPERVAHYAPLVGVSYGRITIRNQRTRWGSCSSKGNLNFNCLLMLTPPEIIDSVVVHELCHRKEMNHSKKFYDEVLRVFPSYPECRRWLKENGELIMAMMREI